MSEQPFNLPEEFMWPAYDGRSIANIPATVASILQTPFDGLPSLTTELWQPMASGAKRVVVLTLDAFGWNLLQAEQAQLAGMINKADILSSLTSIFPSTTVAALSSLWTGVAPAQHGMMGLTMFFPEYATSAQMLSFSPAFGRYPNALIEAGLKPETFLQWPSIAQQLAHFGMPAYSFKGQEIVDSALSKMHGRGLAADSGAISFADMMAQMGQLLDEKASEPLYMFAYWPTIDTLSHFRLWDGASTRAEIRALFYQIEHEFLNRLTTRARQDTLFFVTADHGQSPWSQHIFLEDHPRLLDMLFMRPTGEVRFAYLYAKHGRTDDILHYLHTHLSHAVFALRSEEALAAGFFGPGVETAVISERIGDVVAIMRGDHVLLSRTQEKKVREFKSGHGGMNHAEMQTPWLGYHLDGW